MKFSAFKHEDSSSSRAKASSTKRERPEKSSPATRSLRKMLTAFFAVLCLAGSAGSSHSPQVSQPFMKAFASGQQQQQQAPGQAQQDIHQVRGLANSGRIELPCLVDQANCGEVYYITWTRQTAPSGANVSGSGQSMQQQWSRVYLYTGPNEPHKPMGELARRATFVMPEKAAGEQPRPTARLLIEEPKLADEGLYKCDVTYVKGKCPSISLVRVQVLALPGKAQISFATSGNLGSLSGASDGQLVGPVNEGEQLRLSCLVPGGRPAPRTVLWRKIDSAGRTVNLMNQSNQNRRLEGAVQAELNYTLTSADLAAKFECHVEHDALEDWLARVVVHESELAKGQPSSPEDALLDLHPARASGGGGGLAEWPAARSDHSNSLNSHIVIDLNVAVQSLDLFLTKLNKRNSSERLKEADLVELECVAFNSRPAANISWFNGQELIEQLEGSGAQLLQASLAKSQKPARHKRLLQRNYARPNDDGQTFNTHSFLSIKLSRHEHKAQISCQAQNSLMRQPMVKSLELEVEHAPIVLMEPAAGITLSEGSEANSAQASQPATIYCIYSANPTDLEPNSTRWFKNGQPLDTSDQQHFTESLTNTGYPVLTINQPNRRDAGLYDCQLANSVGSSERLPSGDGCRLEVNFRPSVEIRLLKPTSASEAPRRSTSSGAQTEELAQVDLSQELVVPGSSYLLLCDILEAQPAKIHKFYWFKRPLRGAIRITSGSLEGINSAPQQQLLSITESNQFVLSQVGANFTPAAYSCSASNALGISEQSNQIDFQLSFLPGASQVRLVSDQAQRKSILTSGKAIDSVISSSSARDPEDSRQAIAAGRELLLECLTADLGQPRANIWLWFKNGQPLESSTNLISQSSYRDGDSDNNKIQGASSERESGNNNPIRGLQGEPQMKRSTNGRSAEAEPKARLVAAGRYLFVPSIQLAHKGNYSCVAVNRLGAGAQQSSGEELEVRVALAPSFVRPLPASLALQERPAERTQLELVCQVQCEPDCQLEWLKNNQPLDVAHSERDFLRYQVGQASLEERPEENQFRSVESRLTLEFAELPREHFQSKLLERRQLLTGTNYTCLSSSNSVGLPVRSTTRLVFEYAPEKVIISAPSDKLSLIEGTNGPKLICGASGQPRVQYRWFLLRPGASSNSISNDNSQKLGLGGAGNFRPSRRAHLESLEANSLEEPPINQAANRAFAANSIMGANDLLPAPPESLENNLLELAASGGEPSSAGAAHAQPEAGSSTLDLSQVSMERKQAGHYICEASNKLGQRRQSVYVNIQYKPLCSTLHLHSLDVTLAPSPVGVRKLSEPGFVQAIPHEASPNDHYSTLSETDADFVDLRRTLLVSPLVQALGAGGGPSLRGSIFQSVLGGFRNGSGSELAPSKLKNKNALIHADDYNDNEHQDSKPAGADYWTSFNGLLLGFINNYAKQTSKNYQQRLTERRSSLLAGNFRQNRRSQTAELAQQPEDSSSKSLITFACFAADANPMTNLTFHWSFGGVRLGVSSSELDDEASRGVHLYSNENHTLHVVLVRRLDTESTLNPFKMSLLTVALISEAQEEPEERRVARQMEEVGNKTLRTTLRNGHQSIYWQASPTSLKANRNNHIQFGQEFYSRGSQAGNEVELNAANWEDRIGSLLKCSVANEIGSSDVCHVRLNAEQRLKRKELWADSSRRAFEFARWTMPSLAQKSLLIFSVLIGFGLIIFAVSALLIGPYLRASVLQLKPSGGVKGEQPGSRHKTDTNTGQSSSSQKSSVLGLLGDSSTQGTNSDDDSSGQISSLNHQALSAAGNFVEPIAKANGYLRDQQMGRDSNYDEPLSVNNYLNHNGAAHYNERTPDSYLQPSSTYKPYSSAFDSGKLTVEAAQPASPGRSETAAAKLLANLKIKSLSSRFKVDRIADLANPFRSGGMHAKELSNVTETNTTSLSASFLESDLAAASKLISPTSSGSSSATFFGDSNLRHSYSGALSHHQHSLAASFRGKPPAVRPKPEVEQHLFEQSFLQQPQQDVGQAIHFERAAQSNYSNPMDRFIEQRELLAAEAFYRSHSVRDPAAMYHLGERPFPRLAQDLARIPEVYPRSLHHQRQLNESLNLTLNQRAGQMSARPRNQTLADARYRYSVNGPLQYANTQQASCLAGGLVEQTPFTLSRKNMDTIDSHLSRLPESISGHYQASSMQQYANTGHYNNQPNLPLNSQISEENLNGTVEHIYDTNAYATPEQTPLRKLAGSSSSSQHNSTGGNQQQQKLRVSQLIESFNSKLPE